MTELRAKGVIYYSQADEDYFFDWLKKISIIADYHGQRDELIIRIHGTKIADQDLWELLAIFRRYKIDLRQLSMFANDENSSWFKKEDMVWHSEIFG